MSKSGEAPYCKKHNRYLNGKGLCDKCDEATQELAALRRENEKMRNLLKEVIIQGYIKSCLCRKCNNIKSLFEGKGEGG